MGTCNSHVGGEKGSRTCTRVTVYTCALLVYNKRRKMRSLSKLFEKKSLLVMTVCSLLYVLISCLQKLEFMKTWDSHERFQGQV